MKWIEIKKAKPKFDQDYLVTDGKSIAVARLESTMQTSAGLKHKFDNVGSGDVSHIALITLPNEKEVPNE